MLKTIILLNAACNCILLDLVKYHSTVFSTGTPGKPGVWGPQWGPGVGHCNQCKAWMFGNLTLTVILRAQHDGGGKSTLVQRIRLRLQEKGL